MNKRIIVLILCVSVLSVLMIGCSKESNTTSEVVEHKNKLIIGSTNESTILAESGIEQLEKMGYEVEIRVFDDYVLPNTALADGSIDANLYQHEPYMNNFNESNEAQLTMLSPKLYNYYTGLYSTKAKTVDELPDGGNVGIINEASNINEQLLQLQEVGIIKLSSEPLSGKFYSIADIIENPHNYEFTPTDHLMYRNMDDYACLMGTSSTLAKSGVDPTQNLLKKYVDNTLAEGIAVLKVNENTKWAQDIIKAYSSAESMAKVPASTGFEPAE